MAVIKYGTPFDLNQQAFLLFTVFLTKVFTGGPHPPHSSICLVDHSFFIYIFLFLLSPAAQHIAFINNGTHTKKGEEWIKGRVKKSRKLRDTPSCLRVVVVFFLPSAALCATTIKQVEGK